MVLQTCHTKHAEMKEFYRDFIHNHEMKRMYIHLLLRVCNERCNIKAQNYLKSLRFHAEMGEEKFTMQTAVPITG